MKNIVIFGASGRVGERLVEYALSGQYKVTAFVRDADKIKQSHSNLQILIGDIFNQDQVENAIKGQDIVLSALSGRSTKPDYSILSVGMEHILTGMKLGNVNRILNVVGSGILDDLEYGLRRNRPGYPDIFRNVSAENWRIYESLQKENIHWTMVCAPEMPDGDRTGVYRVLPDVLPPDGKRISVQDVADYILNNLEQVNTFRKRIGIAY